MIGMIGHAERIFFVKEHVLANMSFLSYAYVSRCARHALEPTDHRLMYADDIMICAVSPHSVVAIRSASFNAPWIFIWGQQQQWIGRGGPVARPCWPIVAATISNMQWGTEPTVCKNMPFSIKWYVCNCLYSIPSLMGEHFHLRITHKRHVCEYMFLHKKWSSLHGLSSLSFCRWGPVTLCIYIYPTKRGPRVT